MWRNSHWTTYRWQKRPPVILLADDNEADHALVQRTFGEYCHIEVVTDGVHLLQYFQPATADGKPRPDLILLDINMPRMNGKEVLPRIRETPCGALVPVVVFSSSEAPNDISDCYKAGCNSYVTKPFELQDYQRALELVATYWLGLSVSP
jgi:CheY-like chemotaxis protein